MPVPEVEPVSPYPPSAAPHAFTPATSHAFERHAGELRLRVSAPTLAELFAEAGRALAVLACGGRAPPSPEGAAEAVSLRSHDRAALLVDWLNELIYYAEATGKVWSEFRFTRLTDRDLDASIRGARASKMRPAVNAATPRDLNVTETPHGASATVVFDV
jgi:SHS2 domain-containing protein